MNWIKSVLSKIFSVFSSGAAQAAINKAADYVAKALPIIAVVSQLAAGITPTTIDDAALAAVKSKYPRLFDGSIKTGDELKLYLLGAATTLLQEKYPELSTSIARTAVQLAYTAKTA